MKNIPEVKIGIVAVSRNCFPEELAKNRRKAIVQKYEEKYGEEGLFECPICVLENELYVERALKNLEKEKCNALCVFLGNFGPEIVETILAERFSGPVMFCAAAEESQNDLYDGRGDAYCGLLNASYSLRLRNVRTYIPRNPVGDAEQCADMIHEFLPIARAIIGLSKLKIISFGPRPSNFVACNSPIKALYDIHVEIEENSELDLYEAYIKHENDNRIPELVNEMKLELGEGNLFPDILPKLAQYELTLTDWIRSHKGSRDFVTLTTKCWPAFQPQFGFVPCYVNSRLTAKGYPISCEVDVFGALSEYIGTCVSNDVVTVLDINNTVPRDLYEERIKEKQFIHGKYSQNELFMGFHCGNTSSCKLTTVKMGTQRIMSRFLSTDITKGTIEGCLKPGKSTIFRLQSSPDSKLKAYIAQGEILPVEIPSFGSIGIFAIRNMNRFYRYVLVEKNYPHHTAVLFDQYGKYLFEVFKYLGVHIDDIDVNLDRNCYFVSENPFEED